MASEKVRENLAGRLRKGDTVMVIAGGNKTKRPNRGQVGKILRFVGTNRERVVVEGINMITRHERAKSAEKPSAKVQREGSIHVSNVMYYAEKIKRPVRLKVQRLADNRRVRGYTDPKTKEFVAVDA